MKIALTLTPFVFLGMALAQGPMPPQPQQGRPQQQPQPQQQRQPQPQLQQQRQPQPQPPDFGALKSFLGLSDSQIRQMQQAREKAAKDAEEKTKTLRPQIEEKHRALADLLDKDNADATTVGKTMLEIRGLERQMKQAHEGVRNAGISVMTAEQKAKFKAIQDAAMLPEATREAQRLGLVPGPPQGPGPRQGPDGPMQPMRGPMPGEPGNAPRPRVMGPGQGPMQPALPPGPPRQGEPEGGR